MYCHPVPTSVYCDAPDLNRRLNEVVHGPLRLQ
jgi:hypothetical protein